MDRLSIDTVDAIELAEICEILDEWLAADPVARAGYDRHIGADDAAEDLRTALQHFVAVIHIAPLTPQARP